MIKLSKADKRASVFTMRLDGKQLDRLAAMFGDRARPVYVRFCVEIALNQLEYIDENPKFFKALAKKHNLHEVEDLPKLLLAALRGGSK